MPKIPYKKRKDGRYCKQIIVGIREDGKKNVKTLYSRDWRELDKMVREFQLDLDKGKYVVKDITFGECANLWINSKRGLAQNTMVTYRSNIRRLKPLMDIKLSKLKKMHVQNYINDLCDNGLFSSARNLKILIGQVLNFAIDNNFATCNVADKVVVAPVQKNKRR